MAGLVPLTDVASVHIWGVWAGACRLSVLALAVM